MAKRDVILAEIKKGGATKESLMAAAEVNDKGLASQLTYLRMVGHFPVLKDGVYELTTADVWEERKASSGGAAGKSLTPAERLDRAEKRSKRAASAYDNAKIKKEASPDDRLAALNFVKAEAEFEIAEIMLGKAQEEAANAPAEPEDSQIDQGQDQDLDADGVEDEDSEDLEDLDEFEDDFE